MERKQLTLGFGQLDFLSKTKLRKTSWQKLLTLFLVDCAMWASSLFIIGGEIICSDDYPCVIPSIYHTIVVLVGICIPGMAFIAILLLMAGKIKKESEARDMEAKKGYPLLVQ